MPLKHELRECGGLVILDGLDEVPEAHQRRARIKRAIETFAASFQRCPIVVTSRTYAYQHEDWKLEGFVEVELLPFARPQIEHFVDA